MINKTARTVLLSLILSVVAPTMVGATTDLEPTLGSNRVTQEVTADQKPLEIVADLSSLDLHITKEYQDRKIAEVATIIFKNLHQIKDFSKGKCNHEGCQKIRLAMNGYVNLQLEEQLKALKQTNPRYKARNVISKIFLVSTLALWIGGLGAVFVGGKYKFKGDDFVAGIGFMALAGGFILLIPGIGFFVRAPNKKMFRGCCLNKSSDIFAFLCDSKVAFKKKYYHLRISPSDLNNPNKLNCVFASILRFDGGVDLARYEDATPNEIALATPPLQN